MRQRKEVVIDLSGGRSFINKPNTERYTGNDKERKKDYILGLFYEKG